MELTYILIAAAIVALPVILTLLFSSRSRDKAKVLGALAPPRPAPPTLDDADAVREDVARLLAQGRKVEAIKLMRHKTGLGLKDAKDSVELMERFPASAPPPVGLIATIRRAQDMSDEVQRLVKNGRKVEAIRLLREQSGIGLKEAKDLVDRLG